MTSVLLEHERQLLSDELRTRHSTLACRTRQQLIGLRVESDRRRLLSRKCHDSNITRRARIVNRTVHSRVPKPRVDHPVSQERECLAEFSTCGTPYDG